MTLQFLPPPTTKIATWLKALSPQTIRFMIFCTALLSLSIVIFWRRKNALTGSAGAFSALAAVDFTKPDITAAPIDLTKAGAAVDLPADHPLRNMNNGIAPSELAPFHNSKLTPDQIADALSGIDARLKKLEPPS